MSKVILFSPVRLDATTLELSLRSHVALNGVEQRWYYDDNTNAECSMFLWRNGDKVFRLDDAQSAGEYRNEVTHVWEPERISRVAQMRNHAIEEFLKTDADFLFIVDADLILHPDTVVHLLEQDKDIISEVFWTNWEANGVYAPNVWDVHPYGHRAPSSILDFVEPTQKSVGGLGACTLISRRVLEMGVDYSPLPSTGFDGEDRAFCIRAEAYGVELCADSVLPPFHVYRASQLEEARIWFESGCDPQYFAKCWLTPEWKQQVEASFALKASSSGRRKTLAMCLPGETFHQRYLAQMLTTHEWALSKFSVRVFNCYSSNPGLTRWGLTKDLLAQCPGGASPDYVLWVDDDNVLSAEHLKMLVEDLEAYPDIDMVAGWCMTAHGTTSVGTYNEKGWCVPLPVENLENAGAIRLIDWTGFPCVLVRGALVKKLGPEAWLNIPEPTVSWGQFGEDVSYSKRAVAAGARIVVDPRVKVPHLKVWDCNQGVVTPNQGAAKPDESVSQIKKEEQQWPQQSLISIP